MMAFQQDVMDLEFPGVVAVVAGGARGLGVAIAKGLAEKGAQVYIAGDLVENSTQLWELSAVEHGICYVLPENLSTADEMLAEVAEREDKVQILIDDATAGWSLVFARVDAFYDMLLNGSVDASEPAHVITITSSAHPTSPWESKAANAENARALAEEFSDECVVVNFIENARAEVDMKHVADMAMSLCSQSSASVSDGMSRVDNAVNPVPRSSDQVSFIQAKL